MTIIAGRRPVKPARASRRSGVNMAGAERLISLAAGAALAYGGLRRRGALGIGMAALGGMLTLRGATGHSLAYDWFGLAPDAGERETAAVRGWSQAANIQCSVTIAQSREELYRFFRDVENLPRIMAHVWAVKEMSPTRSHWVVRAPGSRIVEWESEVEDERENERIAWRSVPGADIRNAGSVMFEEAPGGRGTEVTLRLSYEPPMGPLGRRVATLFGQEPGRQARDGLRRLKQIMEAGEIATVEGQPSCRR